MPQDKPTPPDAAFAERFAKSYQYGFFLFNTDIDTSFSDIISDSERYVPLIVNPQSLNVREPFATAVTATQGGGVVVESRGGILKFGQLSGTTAYLPTDRDDDVVVTAFRGEAATGGRRSLTPIGTNTENILGKRSGFLAFHKLRHIFRLYQYERRRGNTKVTMHWFDFKSDELWRIEPQEFSMVRQARRPMLYDYSISFQFIESSNILDETFIEISGFQIPKPPVAPSGLSRDALQRIADTIGAATNSIHAYAMPSVLDSVGRLRDLSSAGDGFVNRVSGAVQRTFQNALRDVNNVVGFFDDVHSSFVTALAIPIAVLRQLTASVEGARAVWFELAPANIQEELNEWSCEVKQLAFGLIAYHLAAFNQSPGQDIVTQNQQFASGRAKKGFTTSLMQETENSAGSPDNNPVIGASGLNLITNVSTLANVKSLEAVPIQTGDTIYAIAQRELGDIRRAIDLIVINNLDAPYIVKDPANKPNNTLAWGEFICKPSSQRVSQVEAQHAQQLVPTYTSNVISAVTALTLTDNTVAYWEPNQWVGFTVTLKHRITGLTEDRVVVSNDTAGTLTINFAFDSSANVTDSFTVTLKIFNPGQPVQQDARAFGRDFLLSWDVNNKATIVFDSRGDAAQISGINNLIQALRIRMLTEPGGLPWHKSYGVAWPIGRPWDESTSLSYAFFARRSLLNDRRIASIGNAQLTLSGSKFSFSAEVRPVQSRKARSITVSK